MTVCIHRCIFYGHHSYIIAILRDLLYTKGVNGEKGRCLFQTSMHGFCTLSKITSPYSLQLPAFIFLWKVDIPDKSFDRL
jgi:hypothetical protein